MIFFISFFACSLLSFIFIINIHMLLVAYFQVHEIIVKSEKIDRFDDLFPHLLSCEIKINYTQESNEPWQVFASLICALLNGAFQ